MVRQSLLLSILVLPAAVGCGDTQPAEPPAQKIEQPLLDDLIDGLPNNFPMLNGAGTAATYSTTGGLDFTNELHTPQGTNGRHCGSCHFAESGWTVRPWLVELLFLTSNGTHPIFNPLDANNPAADFSTPGARRSAYSMLLKGLFRRSATISATAEFEVVAAEDPHGLGTLARPSFFRRPLPTMNFHLGITNGWDGRNTVVGDVHAGLVAQAAGNITGAQQGIPPANPVIVEAIVDYEEALSFAQQTTFGAGRLDACGARGGPQNLSAQTFVAGRFNLFDAWMNLSPGACGGHFVNPKRAQIARGQELFNTALSASGRTCLSCHNAENSGTNFNGILFNVGASDAIHRTPDMPIYSLRNKVTGEIIQTTDAGRGFTTGKWADVNRFKTPTLRGLAARAPYFHNGIAKSLPDLVRFYETSLGFAFTDAQEDDLVAFMNAL